jgi:hypothetical protein
MYITHPTGLVCLMICLGISCAAEDGPAGAADGGPSAANEPQGSPAATPIDPNAVKAALGDPNVVAKLRDLGLQMASNAGVSSPMKMYVVAAADHQDAETILSGDTINDHSPVYVIVMIGGPFTARSHPPGVPAVESNVLTVTVDAATYRVTDLGFVNVEPDLSKIALVTVDLSSK